MRIVHPYTQYIAYDIRSTLVFFPSFFKIIASALFLVSAFRVSLAVDAFQMEMGPNNSDFDWQAKIARAEDDGRGIKSGGGARFDRAFY